MGKTDLIKPLHGLRGLAALIVITFHLAPLRFNGRLGVTLFFVLSGFLMGRLYLSRNFTAREVWFYLSSRFARVYPLFFLVIVAATILNGVFSFHVFDLPPEEMVRHLLLFGHRLTVWTISVECAFYALFLIFWFAQHKGFLGTPLLLAIYLGLALAAPHVEGKFDLLRFLHIFVIGLLVARLSSDPPPFAARLSAMTLPMAAIALSIAAWDYADVYGNPLIGFVAGALVFSAVNAPTSLFGSLLSSPFMIWLGEISFGVYLLHRFAQAFVVELLGTAEKSWLAFSIELALTLAAATLAYRYVEDPMRRLIRRLAVRIEARFAPAEKSPDAA